MRVRQIPPAAFLRVCRPPFLSQSSADEFARILSAKPIITRNEFDEIVTADASDGVCQLSSTLRDKGLITAAEAASLHVSSTPSTFLAPAAEHVTTAPGVAAGQPEKPADPGSHRSLAQVRARRAWDCLKPGPIVAGAKVGGAVEADFFDGEPMPAALWQRLSTTLSTTTNL